MVRAIARQGEAERERRANVIHAEGEPQASQKLLEAARVLAAEQQALQLRYLGTLAEILPLPDEMFTPCLPKPAHELAVAKEEEVGVPH